MAYYFWRHGKRPKPSTDRQLLIRLIRTVERVEQRQKQLERKFETMVIDDLEAVTTRIEEVTAKLQELAKEPNPSDARVQGVTNRLTVVADAAQAIIDVLGTTPPVEEPPVEQPPV